MEGDRERCLAAGMDGHLTKPLKLHVLSDVVERWSSPERGRETLAHLLRLYAGHDLAHLRQIERIRSVVG